MINKINLRGALYLLLLAVTAFLIVTWWTELTKIWREHLVTFLFITSLMSLGIVIQARNFTTFLPEHKTVELLPVVHAWAIAAIVNYLGPFQPGLAARIAILTKQGIAVPESTVATLRQIFAILWITLPISGLCLLLISQGRLVLPAIGLCIAFLVVPSLFPVIRKTMQHVFAWPALKVYSPHIARVVCLPSPRSGIGILAQYLVSASTFYVGYHQFGVQITIAEAFGLACVIYSSSLVAVLPGNFGVLEALCAAFGQINGMPIENSIALAFLYRGANVSGALVLAAITGIAEIKKRLTI